MIIKNFKPFTGQHCETTATGTLLKNIGIELSEPMLFGIGEGLGFIFWNMKTMNFPFKTTAMLMEKAGTGGALFRNLYRDFLKESFDLLQLKQLEEGYTMFYKIAQLWTKISTLFDKAGETENMEFINEASEILIDLSEKEKKTMELLYSIT